MLVSFVRRVIGWNRAIVGAMWRLANARAGHKLARELSRTPHYSFTTDYVSPFATDWKEVLSGLRDQPNTHMLEIGCYEGRSAVWFLKNILTNSTASIVCVDPFPNAQLETRFDHNIAVSGCREKVTKLKGVSEAVVPSLPSEAFDVVYVDGDHRAVHVLMDGVLAWNCLKPGGILIFDDYLWDEKPLPPHERPQMAVDLCLDVFAAHGEILRKDYQVILRKRA
jgi:predicted O-methyltransferase YrrM